MKKFEGCLLVCDIDGTFADHSYIPQSNIDAVRRFMEDGGEVVMTTGRSPQSTEPVVRAVGCRSVIITNNGSLIYDCDTGRELVQYGLGCAGVTYDVLERFPSAGALLYCGSQLQLVRANEQIDQLIGSEALKVVGHSDKMVNKVLFGDRPETVDRIESYCRSINGLDGDVVRSDEAFVEIIPKGVDKRRAMLELASKMGIAPDRIFAAGNYYNDITMLKAAAVSCAPVESPDEVKAQADFISCACREGAVARFIEYLYSRF